MAAIRDEITLPFDESSVRGIQCACKCGKNIPALKWAYRAPTPLLVEKGLSPKILQQELDIIHNKSEESVQGLRNYFALVWIPLLCAIILGTILTLIGTVGVEDYDDPRNKHWKNAIYVFAVGIVSIPLTFTCAAYKTKNQYLKAIGILREYIDISLNEKYQNADGIQWTLKEEKKVEIINNKPQEVTNYHITVSCTQQQIVIQPQPLIVYVDQNGNPLQGELGGTGDGEQQPLILAPPSYESREAAATEM
eukprot:CAMPEP_0202688590 /NCGR_PEP_ID=MMETSP1385-20130828/4089_1 /ASSEMBLY_ACC=CAM_ASM_000861 /TAXON_ID=933848 /ORGANISM="Elphidium margaritaceum" /LENGTH=250 /DNA_ID=CAMNT_0049343599 /DNA_START=37 /DNA_END=789 /DNA_ORIENTATION=+